MPLGIRKLWRRNRLLAAAVLAILAAALWWRAFPHGRRLLGGGQKREPYEKALRKVAALREFLQREVSKVRDHTFTVSIPGGRVEMDSVSLENLSDRPVEDLWLWVEGKPNYYNLQTLCDSVIPPGDLSTRQKALALLEFFRRVPHSHAYALGAEICYPPRLAIHCGLCSELAGAFGMFANFAGIQATVLHLPGAHYVNEFYDPELDKWCYFDADRAKVFFNDSGEIMGLEELLAKVRSLPDFRQRVESRLAGEDPSTAGDDGYWNYFIGRTGALKGRLPQCKPKSRFAGLAAAVAMTSYMTLPTFRWNMSFLLHPGERVRIPWQPGSRWHAGRDAGAVDAVIARGRDPLPFDASCGGVLVRNPVAEWDVRLHDARPELAFESSDPFPVVDARLELAVRTGGEVRLYYSPRSAARGPRPGSVRAAERLLWQHRGDFDGAVDLGGLCKVQERQYRGETRRFATGVPLYSLPLALRFSGPAHLRKLLLVRTLQLNVVGLESFTLEPGKNVVHVYGPPFERVLHDTDEQGFTTTTAIRTDGLRIRFRYRIADDG